MAASEQNKFSPPAMVEGDFNRDEIAEDAGGFQIVSFQQVKIPAGSALRFGAPMENPDSPDYTQTLEGIILYSHSAYTLWPEGNEYDEDTKPLCLFMSGKTGIDVPGGACATCSMDAYRSAKDGGRGKACKNTRHFYLLRSGEYIPLLVSLPPTSIRLSKESLNGVSVCRQRATCGSLVQIGLKKDSNGNNDYSIAAFRLLRDFQEEELAQICAYASAFKGQVRTIDIQWALINREQRANDYDYEIPEPATAALGLDESYVVGEINGDYEQLLA